MTEIQNLGWVESKKLGVSIYAERETLSEFLDYLHDALLDAATSARLMDHVISAMPSAWRVQDNYDRCYSGWSKLRTFELMEAHDAPVIASLLAYADSHGGMWIELVANTDIRDKMARAISSFFTPEGRSSTTAHRSSLQ